MGRKLARAVQVGSEFYPVGAEVPAEVAEQITSPVWDESPAEGEVPAKKSAPRKSSK